MSIVDKLAATAVCMSTGHHFTGWDGIAHYCRRCNTLDLSDPLVAAAWRKRLKEIVAAHCAQHGHSWQRTNDNAPGDYQCSACQFVVHRDGTPL